MIFSIQTIVIGLWIVAIGFWIIRAFGNKRTVHKYPFQKFLVLLSVAILICIGMTEYLWPGMSERPFVDDNLFTSCIGLSLTIAGMGFAVWSRITIGRNWSGLVTLKEDHALIKTGPYALVRHPIYTGIVLAIFGTAIVFQEIGGLIIAIATFILLKLKSHIEEQFMAEQFGAQYNKYKRQVKSFIPYIY